MKILGMTFFIAFFSIALAHADFTLTDNSTGARYSCGNGNGGDTGGGSDPDCVQNVATFCASQTHYSRVQCFDKASASCNGVRPGYSDCIEKTATFCAGNTHYSRTECFDKALLSCRGTTSASLGMMEAVRSFATLRQKGLSVEQIRSMNPQ